MNFLKTTLVGGIFVLVPLVIFYLLLAELLQLVVTLVTPIADLFPKGTFGQVKMPVIITVILIVGVSFLFGLATHSAALRQFGRWIERILLGRLPLYDAVKRLGRGLVSEQGDSAFQSAVLNSSNGEQEIVYVISLIQLNDEDTEFL